MADAFTFDYAAEDLLNPRGQNGMGTRAAFYQRSLYKEKIYPSEFPSPLDTWYNKLLYGRVDRFQNSVVPALQNLKTIPRAGMPNMRALNAVVDIFERFAAHMAKGVLMSAVNPKGNSRLLDLKAIRAYESPNAAYAQFTQSLYEAFYDNLSGTQQAGIKDFGSFLKFYRHYLLTLAKATPITKTNYLISQNCNIFTSGTSIAIANEDAGSDAVKYEKYLTDPNFEFYRKCAKKFGFMIDKNIPWVLTADLFSTAFEDAALVPYATAGGFPITRENFFNVFYNKTHLTDFTDLTYLFINSYITLVNASPYYDSQGTVGAMTLSGCPVISKLRVPLMEPTPVVPPDGDGDLAALDAPADPGAVGLVTPTQDVRATLSGANVLTDKFLIDFYIDLRQAEIGDLLSDHSLKSLKAHAYEIYQLRPFKSLTALQNVADFVNTIYRDHIYEVGAVALQFKNAKTLDNRVTGGTLLVENGVSRQLY